MIYIKRNDENEIVALSHIQQKGFVAAEDNSPEVMAYIKVFQDNNALELLRADLDFIRVIEDVIDVLINKNLINITDFHPAVIEKLLKRQKIRKEFTGLGGMDFDEDSETI